MLTHSPSRLWTVLALGVLVAGAWGAWTWTINREQRKTWTERLPKVPELSSWPAPFLLRIQKATTKVAHWPPEENAVAELARLYLANGFVEQAKPLLGVLRKMQPANPRWPYYLANASAGFGQLEDAVLLWNETLALSADYLPAELKLADALRKLNRPQEALSVYATTLRRLPKNSDALVGLAVIAMESGNWDQAKARLQEVLANDSNHWAAFSLFATVADISAIQSWPTAPARGQTK